MNTNTVDLPSILSGGRTVAPSLCLYCRRPVSDLRDESCPEGHCNGCPPPPWAAPTLDRVECAHCNEPVADRPFPPADHDAAWSLEALHHRLGCAAILTRDGARPAPLAPTFARGTHYPDGDPCWGRTLDGARLIPLDVLKDGWQVSAPLKVAAYRLERATVNVARCAADLADECTDGGRVNGKPSAVLPVEVLDELRGELAEWSAATYAFLEVQRIAEPTPHPAPLFYILSMERSTAEGGGACMWWRPDGNGYTAKIAEAGRYTREDAIRRADPPHHVAIPCDAVEVPSARARVLAKAHGLRESRFDVPKDGGK